MRRFICIFSAFTLLVGCVKNEPFAPDGHHGAKAEIAFESPIVAPKTKAVTEITGDFPTTLDMRIWGIYSESEYPSINADDNTVGIRYIDGAAFTNQGEVWGGKDGSYYWPSNGCLHFVGYAPATPAGGLTVSTVTDEGLQLTGYTVPDEADEDFLISQVSYSRTRPSDASAGAPILFDHALTSVVFKAKSGIYGDRTEEDPDRIDTDLRVVKIEVVARGTGDFSQQMTAWDGEQMTSPDDATAPEKGWTVDKTVDVRTFVAYDDTSSPLTRSGGGGVLGFNQWGRGIFLTDDYQFVHDHPDGADVGCGLTDLILLPQVLEDGAILRVTYDMTHTGLADLNEAEDGLWLEQVVELPLNQCGVTEWLRGHRYCYNLTVSLGKIECKTDVAAWTEEPQKEF